MLIPEKVLLGLLYEYGTIERMFSRKRLFVRKNAIRNIITKQNVMRNRRKNSSLTSSHSFLDFNLMFFNFTNQSNITQLFSGKPIYKLI